MPQRVPMKSCVDGTARARTDVLFGLNPVSNDAPTAKTASYTITGQEYGCGFSNSGAGGPVTFTMPAAFAGAIVGPIFKLANQNIILDGAGNDTINGSATLQNTASEANSAVVMLVGISSTAWIAMVKVGTWNGV